MSNLDILLGGIFSAGYSMYNIRKQSLSERMKENSDARLNGNRNKILEKIFHVYSIYFANKVYNIIPSKIFMPTFLVSVIVLSSCYILKKITKDDKEYEKIHTVLSALDKIFSTAFKITNITMLLLSASFLILNPVGGLSMLTGIVFLGSAAINAYSLAVKLNQYRVDFFSKTSQAI